MEQIPEKTAGTFPFSLTPQQSQALQRLQLFVLNPQVQVFILKGYAGTGKTTLMQYLMKWMLDEKKVKDKYQPYLCATTGRAAKVLRDKTGFETSTVHSFIYAFKNLNQDLEQLEKEIRTPQATPKTNQLSLMFDLRPPVQAGERSKQQVIIVDESSMLSDEQSGGDHTAQFGSGKLLTDLMQYAKNAKLIFVGDGCQLPPIEQPNSPALDDNYISNSFNKTVDSFELTDIVRQQKEHSILKLSLPLRHCVKNPQPGKYANLPAKGLDNIYIHRDTDELIEEYIHTLKNEGYETSIFITRSNAFNYHISNYIRKQLGFTAQLPMPGDLMQVTQNNYLVPLVNGDFVVVTAAGQIKVQGNIAYLEIIVRGLHDGKHHQSLLALPPLTRTQPNLTSDEHREMYMDFYKRMAAKKIKQNTPAFNDIMLTDPYLNSLRAAYGYAVTCNKSQGGEWQKVYLHMETKIHGMGKPQIYQWWYTAVTRSRQELHMADDWFISVYEPAFISLFEIK
jgi:ATP-dependent exoDNAse (exonuclease V) alpha subunit